MSALDPARATPSAQQEPSLLLWAATLVSLAALAGSLYLSIGMGLKACPLCLYQRTFVMAVVAVLVVGLFIKELNPGVLSVLALPLAAGGLFVALWHEYLEQTGALECPAGVLAVGTAPQQSVAILLLLVALLVLDLLRQRRAFAILACAVLGLMLAFSAVRRAVPPIPNYRLSVDEDMCRKPQEPRPPE
jgi:disulfide bond formation protein DsbB